MRAVNRRVLKFGGTSVATAASLQSLVAIAHGAVREAATVVVVSALARVTDALDAALADATAGRTRPAGIADDLLATHLALLAAVASGVPRDEAEAALHTCAAELGDLLRATVPDDRDAGASRVRAAARRDAVLACGERLSVAVVTAALLARGVEAFAADARALIRTDGAFGAAEVDFVATRAQVRASLGATPRWAAPVVAGFIGATADGRTTTLGRGGSDYSAAILAWALDATRVEIWTDVDGVMTADPTVVREARPLPRLSYRAAATLAAGGARVLHPRTLEPLERAGIPVIVRNTFRPDRPGTHIGAPGGACGNRGAVASRVHGDRAHVVVLGRQGAGRPARLRAVLRASGVEPRAVTAADGGLTIRVVVDAPQHHSAVRAIHAHVIAPSRVNVVVAGPRGRVATALLARLARQQATLGDHQGLDLRLVGVFDRSRVAWDPAGLPPGEAAAALAQGTPADWRASVVEACRATHAPLVFVDATASADVADVYPALLEAGVGIATPNKIANSRALGDFQRLHRLAADAGLPYLYATTVGAGLPVLRTVRALVESGDRLHALTASLSGTLSFVLGRVQEGLAFTAAVAEAQRLGYTEPDPRIDLSGEDVARKLLVVVREAGVALERDDVEVASLVPAAGEDVDARWARDAAAAHARGERLVHVARWDGTRATVGVASLPADDPLARAQPGENVVRIWTDRYAAMPVTLAGPGAGPDVTAGNLLTDVIEAAQVLARGDSARRVPRSTNN